MSLLMLRTAVDVGQVDKENKIIHGVAMIRKGAVSDSRGWIVTEETLNQVLELASAVEDGVRARYGHPQPGENMLDRFLGRWKNFRRDGDVIRADLHLAETAFKTPNGDIAGYVLELSQVDPRALGVSIHAPFANDFDGLNIKIKKIKAFDIVDEPAGTDDGMFSEQPEFDVALSELIDGYFKGKESTEVAESLGAFLSTHYSKGDSEMSEKDKSKEGQLLSTELQLGEFDTDAIKEQGRIEERKRASKITSLCTLSECPEKAAELIKGDFTYEEAEGLVTTLMERKNAVLSEDGGIPKKKEEDPDKKYKERYQADKEILGSTLTLSEEEYIASLKVSESGGVLTL